MPAWGKTLSHSIGTGKPRFREIFATLVYASLGMLGILSKWASRE